MFCHFNLWCELRSRGWVGKQWQSGRGRSDPGCSCPAHSVNWFASQVRLLALRTSGSRLLSPSCSTWDMKEWVNMAVSCAAGAGERTDRFTKTTVGMESSDDEFGILEDERCIDTGAFKNRNFLHELVFACMNPAPLRPHMRTVAKCEVALLPVAGAMRAGARVIRSDGLCQRSRVSRLCQDSKFRWRSQ